MRIKEDALNGTGPHSGNRTVQDRQNWMVYSFERILLNIL
jgi:hypothetical protein